MLPVVPRKRFQLCIRQDLPGCSFVLAFAFDELLVVFVEGIADVFVEDQSHDDVLVFRCVHIGPQLIRRQP